MKVVHFDNHQISESKSSEKVSFSWLGHLKLLIFGLNCSQIIVKTWPCRDFDIGEFTF